MELNMMGRSELRLHVLTITRYHESEQFIYRAILPIEVYAYLYDSEDMFGRQPDDQ